MRVLQDVDYKLEADCLKMKDTLYQNEKYIGQVTGLVWSDYMDEVDGYGNPVQPARDIEDDLVPAPNVQRDGCEVGFECKPVSALDDIDVDRDTRDVSTQTGFELEKEETPAPAASNVSLQRCCSSGFSGPV